MKSLLAFLLLSLPLWGQNSSVNLRVLVFPRSSDDSPVHLRVGEKLVPVELTTNRLSDPYSVPRQATWTFGQQAEDAAGNPSFNILGSEKSIGARSQLVILLRKGEKNEDGFKVLVQPAGKEQFGGRQFLIMNLTNNRVGGEIGTVKFGLNPAAQTVISPKSIPGKDLCHASILLELGEKWRPLIATNWPLRDDARGLIFIYTDPRRKKVRLHTIRDIL